MLLLFGRQHQGMDRPGVRQVHGGSGKRGKNGGNWLRNHLWCPNDPRGSGIDDDVCYRDAELA